MTSIAERCQCGKNAGIQIKQADAFHGPLLLCHACLGAEYCLVGKSMPSFLSPGEQIEHLKETACPCTVHISSALMPRHSMQGLMLQLSAQGPMGGLVRSTSWPYTVRDYRKSGRRGTVHAWGAVSTCALQQHAWTGSCNTTAARLRVLLCPSGQCLPRRLISCSGRLPPTACTNCYPPTATVAVAVAVPGHAVSKGGEPARALNT